MDERSWVDGIMGKSFYYQKSNEELDAILKAKLLKARYNNNKNEMEETIEKLEHINDASKT